MNDMRKKYRVISSAQFIERSHSNIWVNQASTHSIEREKERDHFNWKKMFMQISYLFSIPLIPNQKSLLQKFFGCSMCVCVCEAKNSKRVSMCWLMTSALVLMYRFFHSCICLSHVWLCYVYLKYPINWGYFEN